MCLARILQNHLILNRIKDHLFFPPLIVCVDHIHMLRIIIEQSAKYRSDLHLVFVDFEKAFDSVDRVPLDGTEKKGNT